MVELTVHEAGSTLGSLECAQMLDDLLVGAKGYVRRFLKL